MVRHLTVSTIWSNNQRVAQIRLTGNWLAENDFQIGRKIRADMTPGRLLVKLVTVEERRVDDIPADRSINAPATRWKDFRPCFLG